MEIAMKDGFGAREFTIKSGSRVMVKFEGSQGQEMKATITPLTADVAGYRISQLFFPDGASDGPFQNTAIYTLPRTGKYGIRIAPYTALGTAGSGKMRIEISLR
jgi:hypothetical protein